jgi:prophage regulatory protein
MRLIKVKEVKERTGLSRTSIWRGIQAGTFPESVPTGERSVAFVEEEVDAWIKSCIEHRNQLTEKKRDKKFSKAGLEIENQPNIH